MNSWRLILAHINKGQLKSGVAKGPQKLLKYLALKPDAIINPSNNLLEELSQLNHVLWQPTNKKRDLIIGGDHSLSMATASSSLSKNPKAKLIWVDAHADINTPETSPSGNWHGMPVASLLGLMSQPKLISPQNILYVGIRDIDPEEQRLIEELSISMITSQDIHHNMTQSLKKIDQFVNQSPVHLSLDIDVLDKTLVPGTGTPVDKGLTREQLSQILKIILAKNIICMDLVEFNPELDQDDKTLNEIKHILELIKIKKYNV